MKIAQEFVLLFIMILLAVFIVWGFNFLINLIDYLMQVLSEFERGIAFEWIENVIPRETSLGEFSISSW